MAPYILHNNNKDSLGRLQRQDPSCHHPQPAHLPTRPGKHLETLQPPSLSLRDILAADLYNKETSITHAKKINVSDLSVTLADQVISVYSKASFEFQPGKNMLPIKSIRKKIERDWLRQLTSGERGASCTMSPVSWTIVSVKSFHVWRKDAVLSV